MDGSIGETNFRRGLSFQWKRASHRPVPPLSSAKMDSLAWLRFAQSAGARRANPSGGKGLAAAACAMRPFSP